MLYNVLLNKMLYLLAQYFTFNFISLLPLFAQRIAFNDKALVNCSNHKKALLKWTFLAVPQWCVSHARGCDPSLSPTGCFPYLAGGWQRWAGAAGRQHRAPRWPLTPQEQQGIRVGGGTAINLRARSMWRHWRHITCCLLACHLSALHLLHHHYRSAFLSLSRANCSHGNGAKHQLLLLSGRSSRQQADSGLLKVGHCFSDPESLALSNVAIQRSSIGQLPNFSLRGVSKGGKKS